MNNYRSAANGRIWVNWDARNVQITYLFEHEHALMFEVFNIQSGKKMYLIAVYALNTIEQRKQL